MNAAKFRAMFAVLFFSRLFLGKFTEPALLEVITICLLNKRWFAQSHIRLMVNKHATFCFALLSFLAFLMNNVIFYCQVGDPGG